jgi:hypothetical protein
MALEVFFLLQNLEEPTYLRMALEVFFLLQNLEEPMIK